MEKLPVDAEEEVNTDELISTLPKAKNWDHLHYLYNYEGCWYPSKFFKGVINFQTHFQAQDSDIILASIPKAGTTWLKALAFSITNRSQYPHHKTPLLTNNPHRLIPTLEMDTFWKKNQSHERIPSLKRILTTHVPFASLPDSIVGSNCRIVCICRHPLDQFISYWHFFVGLRDQNLDPFPIDEAFDMFCDGVHGYGPVWEHMLGYWKASREDSGRVLFLRYEDLKGDTRYWVKKLGEFLECPFCDDDNEAEEIVRLCSFENLKGLEVNKSGEHITGAKNGSFFRKGEVGDWTNHLSSVQALRFQKLLQEKLEGSGLAFKIL